MTREPRRGAPPSSRPGRRRRARSVLRAGSRSLEALRCLLPLAVQEHDPAISRRLEPHPARRLKVSRAPFGYPEHVSCRISSGPGRIGDRKDSSRHGGMERPASRPVKAKPPGRGGAPGLAHPPPYHFGETCAFGSGGERWLQATLMRPDVPQAGARWTSARWLRPGTHPSSAAHAPAVVVPQLGPRRARPRRGCRRRGHRRW